MAISPKDIRLDVEELRSVERLEVRIDSYLRKNFTPGSSKRLQVFVVEAASARIMMELISRYCAVGWTVRRSIDNSDYLEFEDRK